MELERAEKLKLESDHGHCADVLMSDYGIPKDKRAEVCGEIAKVWVWDLMFHDIIIAGIRGYMPNAGLNSLKRYLESNQTQEPKNHKRDFSLGLEDTFDEFSDPNRQYY